MTFAMYEALYDGLRGGRRRRRRPRARPPRRGREGVRGGTDIRQFADFDESGADALAYEATIDRIVGRLETVRKPTVALVDGFAMGSASRSPPPATCASARRPRLRPPDRAHGRQLPLDGELRAARGAARPGAPEGHRLHRPLDRGRGGARDRPGHRGRRRRAEARVEELCELLASHAPVTLYATKEALRRSAPRPLPDGEDLIREAYGCEGFRRNVQPSSTDDRPAPTPSSSAPTPRRCARSSATCSSCRRSTPAAAG